MPPTFIPMPPGDPLFLSSQTCLSISHPSAPTPPPSMGTLSDSWSPSPSRVARSPLSGETSSWSFPVSPFPPKLAGFDSPLSLVPRPHLFLAFGALHNFTPSSQTSLCFISSRQVPGLLPAHTHSHIFTHSHSGSRSFHIHHFVDAVSAP